MKKIIALLLAALFAVTLVSCTDNAENENTSGVYENVDLAAVADSLYDGIAEDNRPFVMSMPLTAEDFEFSAFIPYEEGFEAVVNEPMMGSIAHSIVLVKCSDEAKAKEVAAAMEAACNPRKWVCVEADIVKSATNGNIAMLLMTTTQGGLSETILANFNALNQEKIASLKSETVEDEAVAGEEASYDEELVDGEVAVEGEDVVYDYSEEDVGDEPAAMTEEDNMPAVMPAL